MFVLVVGVVVDVFVTKICVLVACYVFIGKECACSLRADEWVLLL